MSLTDWMVTGAIVLLMVTMSVIAVGLWVVEPVVPVWPPFGYTEIDGWAKRRTYYAHR